MCNHIWRIVNDVRVCQRCGLTVRRMDGKIMFDRDFANIAQKGRKNK